MVSVLENRPLTEEQISLSMFSLVFWVKGKGDKVGVLWNSIGSWMELWMSQVFDEIVNVPSLKSTPDIFNRPTPVSKRDRFSLYPHGV
jgi:hypothetical protein